MTLLKLLNTKPLLSFLLTPVLATIPLPKQLRATSLKLVSWKKVALYIFVLTTLHETNRVGLLAVLRLHRRRSAFRAKQALGKVVARGKDVPLPPSNPYDDDPECIICSGVGTDRQDPMAMSISSFTSYAPTEAAVPPSSVSSAGDSQSQAGDSGPLEAFCTVAPHLHVVHRECFLRWAEAYRQQHAPEAIFVRSTSTNPQGSSNLPSRERQLTQEVIQAAGFGHLLPVLLYRDPSTITSPPPPTSQPIRRPPPSHASAPAQPSILTMLSSTTPPVPINSYSSAPSSPTTIATLTTSSPSCPACRGSVEILFECTPPTLVPPVRSSDSSLLLHSTQTYHELAKWVRRMSIHLGRMWRKEWGQTVTGRTLLMRLVAQYSFVLVLVSMAKASSRRQANNPQTK